jgi:hypothetical protein
VTYDGLRDPKTKKGYGKTRTLAESLVPFGWALLTTEPGYAPDLNFEDPVHTDQAASPANGPQSLTSVPQVSEQEQRQNRLDNLQKELDAIKPANRPGIIPNKAKEVLADEDQEYVSMAAKVILNFVHGTGMKKKVKSKDWYQELQSATT